MLLMKESMLSLNEKTPQQRFFYFPNCPYFVAMKYR